MGELFIINRGIPACLYPSLFHYHFHTKFMKKFVPLLILCCLSFAGFAQSTNTVSVNATGASGSYKTGYTQATSGRVDGDIVVGDASPVTATRGYAVFNLAGVVPAGATVDSVYLRFNYTTANTSTFVRGKIYGKGLDLSTVTSSATLFADCMNGSYFDSSYWGASLTGAVKNIGFNNNGISFIQSSLGTAISIGFVTDTPGNTYTIVGEGGTTATQPKLTIKYHCTGVSGVVATANPNPVCNGSTFLLHGGGTGGSTYAWSGPSSYTSTLQNPTVPIIAADTTVGVYNYTAYNAAGCATSVIAYVVMSAIPLPIHGPSSLCAGSSIILTDSTAGGFWSVTPSTAGTITTGGVFIAGIDSNTAHISYTLSDGCKATDSVAVLPNPQPIIGTTTLCSGLSSTLSDPTPLGTWSISPASVASISTGGVLTANVFLGLTTYSATITYTLPTGCKVTAGATVLPQPGPITGATILCAPTSTTLTDAYSGTWSCAPTTVANVNPSTGVVTGVGYGIATIKYTNPYGCFVSSPMYVAVTAPAPITGASSVCPILTDTLHDAIPGGFWQAGSANATVDTNGVVLGISAGVVPISYYNGCGMSSVYISVTTPPAHMTGTFHVCVGSTTTLADATTPGIWTGSNGSIATVAAGFGTVMGNSYGGLIITYTSPVTGCIDTANFQVDSIPHPITGTFNTCPGDNVVLTDITTGGTWSSQNVSIATVDTGGVVTGVSANTTTITYALASTGCYVTASMLVNPNPSPITGIKAVCQGLLDTVSDATPGGSWTSSNNTVAGILTLTPPTTAQIVGSIGGTVTISYTLPATGCRATATEVIHPTPNPVITFNGGATTLYTGTYYATYQWYKNGVLIPGATTWSLAGLTDGLYTVFVTDTFGCQVMSIIYTLTHVSVPVVSAGVHVNIFPNPANSTVNIQCPVAVRAMIASMDGKLIMERNNATTIDISSLSTGVYLISLYDEAGERLTVQKLIKE